MDDNIFVKIIKGEVPCHRVYEDERTIAFMDIHPIQPGMVLVVPKFPVDHFMDLPDEDYQALMTAVKKIARRMHEVFPDQRIGVQIEGLDVPHAHVKLFPFTSGEQFHARPDTESQPDHDGLAEMAKRLSVNMVG